jgi:hypothetical protein
MRNRDELTFSYDVVQGEPRNHADAFIL